MKAHGKVADDIAREYADFAYIVSHDLSAPLRHIREFSKLLLVSVERHIGDEEKEYAAFLEKSLNRIEEMQKALLVFSRLDTQAAAFQDVDCALVVKDALCRYNFAEGESVICGDLPVIKAEPAQMAMLFEHLIDNAIKFHDKNVGSGRHVSISAKDEGMCYIFEVSDNGIGISPHHHDDVFRIFRSLSPEQFEGNGVGLALVRKIIDRHGGSIKIESEEGQGTKVLFSIPKSE